MSTTNYAGIDYGRGLTNIDPKNGIRYGIIGIHDVVQAYLVFAWVTARALT